MAKPKAPNLVKTLGAWGRFRLLWSNTLPITLGNILGQSDQIKSLRKR